MSSWWKKVKKSLKKVGKKIKKTFTDPEEALKEFTGSSILAGAGIPSMSGVGSSVIDALQDKRFQKEMYGALEGKIPYTKINPIDRYLGRDIAENNLQYQKDAYEYQKWLNQQTMDREDNAVQRRVDDLIAAGYNPILAAGGSGASATALRAGAAPQETDISGGYRDLAHTFFGFLSMKKDWAVKDANVQMMQANAARAEQEALGLSIENKYKDDYYSGRNVNIGLRNESLEIANYWSPILNQSKLDTVKSNLDKVASEIEKNDALIGLLKEQKVTEIKKHVLQGLEASDLSSKISQRYLDIMATAYSLQWYTKHDLPMNGANHNHMILMAVDKVLEFLTSGKGKKSYGIDPDSKGAPPTSLNLDNAYDEDGNLKGFDDSIFGFLGKLFQ